MSVDAALQRACADSCAEYGDPPCYRLPEIWRPCADCWRAIGLEPPVEPEALDPDAVVKPLL